MSKKPLTVGEVRRKKRSKAANTKLKMGPALFDKSKVRTDRAEIEVDTEHLSRRRDEYLEQLGEKTKLMKGRLASQGLKVPPGIENIIPQVVSQTGIEVADSEVPEGAGGAHHRYRYPDGSYKQRIALREYPTRKGAPESAKTYSADILDHELDHATDHAARRLEGGKSLSERQHKLLGEMGAISEESHGAEAARMMKAHYSPSHIRTGIMAMRRITGKEFLTGQDIENMINDLSKDKAAMAGIGRGNEAMRTIRWIMETDPNKNFDEIAAMINQVATRQKVAARASEEWV